MFGLFAANNIVPIETRPNLDIKDIVHELKLWLQEMEYNDCDELDVRLRVYEGESFIYGGDPSYDTDHRGVWASGMLWLGMSDEDITNVAIELIQDILDLS